MDSKAEKRHKGTFVGGHLYDRQMEKFEQVMTELSAATGQPANAAATLRYIIEHFSFDDSPLGKELAPALEMALA